MVCLIPLVAYDQSDLITVGSASAKLPAFIENKGQILDQDQRPAQDLLYLLPLGNGLNVQLKRNSFSYDTYQSQASRETAHELLFHRLDISFPGARPCPEVRATLQSPEKLHFTHPEVSNVRQFRKITYLELYPHIDLEMIAAPGPDKPVEYNFILHPGARLSDIRIQYEGSGKTHFGPDQLRFQLLHGHLAESIPASFWEQDGTQVDVQYQLLVQDKDKLTVGFSAPVDRIDRTLIIDPIPQLDWGTYLGGSGNDNSRDMTLDAAGNVYLVGSSSSPNAIATTGTHQNTLAGNSDVFIARFDNDGVRQWSTYLGGTENEFGQNIALDAAGNIYVTGVGNSPAGVTTPGAAQVNFAGGSSDAFVAKFDNNGVRQWSTYLGGPGIDYANALTVDEQGNVYISGWTNSTTGIASAGAYQTVFSQAQDVFLAKYDAQGALQWSTYYGDTGLDIGLQLEADATGNVWLSGWTSSTAGIAMPGSHQVIFGGGSADAFLVRFSSTGMPLWASYYGGSGDDYGDALKLDSDGNLYLAGPSTSPDAMATPGAHQTALSGGFDGFLAKFSPGGLRQWGTYYGGPQDEAAYGIALDQGNNVYLTGFTNSQMGIATPDAHQTNFNGGDWDAFLVKFDQGAQMEWGTYYGGSETDQSFAVAVDGNDRAFIAGITSSVQDISTAGSHQLIQGGGNDAFLARFSPCREPVLDVPNGGYLCGNQGFVLELNFSGAGPYTFGYTIDGVPQAPVTIPTSSYILSLLEGEYQDSVVIAEVSSGACVGQITGLPFIKVAEPLSSAGPVIMCEDGTDTYVVEVILEGGMFGYQSVNPDAGFINGNVFTSRAMPADQPYFFQLTSGLGCDTLVISGNSGCGQACADFIVTATATSPICEGEDIQLGVDGGLTFRWSGPVGFSSEESAPLIANAGRVYSGSYQVIATDGIGCVDTAAVLVEVQNAPRIEELQTIALTCQDSSTDLTIIAEGNGNLEYSIDGADFFPGNTFDDLGIGAYDVFVRDEAGCITVQNLLVQRADGPVITAIGIEAPSCGATDGIITITAEGNNQPLRYSINGGTDFQDGNTFEALAGGSYDIVVSDPEGCTITADVKLAMGNEPPVINEIMIEQSACTANQNSVIVNAVSSGSELEYALDGNNFQAENRFSGLPSGTYTVTVRNEAGCRTTGEVFVPRIDVLTLGRLDTRPADCLGNNGHINIVTSGGSGQLTFTLNDTIVQNDGSFNELVPGYYQWKVTDGSGCTLSDAVTISRGDCPIYIANAFSPNGDGVNDKFSLFSASGIRGQVVTYDIYNRWGNLVFRSGGFPLEESGQWWDGTVNGQPAESGVYVYYLIIDLEGGEQLVEKGEFNLLR
jgi:gliding motility-associated-like protein